MELMNRRRLLTIPVWLALGNAACSALPNARGGQPGYTVSADQLQQAVAKRFALRYEASDQSIRAHQLHVNSLRFADLPPGPSELLKAYGPALAAQSLREVVLHKLRPQDLALPDAMGLQPDRITVTPKGLLISFVNKQPR